MISALRAAALLALCTTSGGAPAASPGREAAASQLLALHQEVMTAHRTGDPTLLLGRESEEYVVASAGAVTFPTLEERAEMFGAYLRTTRFETYEDLIEPVVQVSPDGRLGWVIVQVGARGVQDRGDGTGVRVEFVSAWIELYENRDGRWYRVGNVSNFKPGEAAAEE